MSSPSIKPSHEGRLHRALHVPEGQSIPASKLQAAQHSRNPHMRQMANYAENARHWHHDGADEPGVLPSETAAAPVVQHYGGAMRQTPKR